MAQRTVRFKMDELARVAAATVGAFRCVHVEKCPDGLYNKAYIFRMDDGREVIGKVPNPNAGPPHYTTASEVATIEFMRTVLSTPTPKVLAWDSRAERNAVGAEYIIMEKAEGVGAKVWETLGGAEKVKASSMMYLVKGGLFSARPLEEFGTMMVGNDWDVTEAHQLPAPTKQWVMLTGPRLYQPTPPKKLWAINAYLEVLEHIF
ncbi:hypothetical protein NEMBOFW57_006602 [Staphylotrichum longicolle]|uniref:Altered inheritance of mitochondria protein 9, mitochondrial n=1 Tax=Staphylotrichum longicolle TaxID=669026 RepID=A0AAD4ET44_9PEZI|nr:hypothetical protein NEMBOFW57_006602 [Staphylotrichum longicolle]